MDDSDFPSDHEQVKQLHWETHRLLKKISEQLYLVCWLLGILVAVVYFAR